MSLGRRNSDLEISSPRARIGTLEKETSPGGRQEKVLGGSSSSRDTETPLGWCVSEHLRGTCTLKDRGQFSSPVG
jgi:hypothetical protein